MRYNLKNYPTDGYWMSAYKWKEAFKKELQEKIAYLKSMEPEELYDYIHDKKFEKEILGEDASERKKSDNERTRPLKV